MYTSINDKWYCSILIGRGDKPTDVANWTNSSKRQVEGVIPRRRLIVADIFVASNKLKSKGDCDSTLRNNARRRCRND